MRNSVSMTTLGALLALLLASCDGADPADSGCAADAVTVDSADLSANGHKYARLELRYSGKCRSAWARVTLTSSLSCVPGDDHCATASIVRNSDGESYGCHTPAGVGTSCYTAQVNDANVTAHAEATFDNGPSSYFAKTGSFDLDPGDPFVE